MIKELRKQQKLGFFLIPSDIVFFFLYLDLIIRYILWSWQHVANVWNKTQEDEVHNFNMLDYMQVLLCYDTLVLDGEIKLIIQNQWVAVVISYDWSSHLWVHRAVKCRWFGQLSASSLFSMVLWIRRRRKKKTIKICK